MNKLLLAASLVFGGSTLLSALPGTSLQAEAKEYQMTSNLANKLKKGTFPSAKGKVGSIKKNLKLKKEHGYWYDPSSIKSILGQDVYIFNSSNVTSKSKVTLIERSYSYLISNSSIEKKLGKELNYYDPNNSVVANRTSFYKAGKYYVGVYKFASISDIYTVITVGTKAKTSAHYDIVFY